jgi:hypothetical protein
VAIVRLNRFSLDWYSPDRQVVHRAPNSMEIFTVGRSEDWAEVDTMCVNSITFQTTVGEGELDTLQTIRDTPPGTGPSIDDLAWPEKLPIFRAKGTLVSP